MIPPFELDGAPPLEHETVHTYTHTVFIRGHLALINGPGSATKLRGIVIGPEVPLDGHEFITVYLVAVGKILFKMGRGGMGSSVPRNSLPIFQVFGVLPHASVRCEHRKFESLGD